MLPLLLPTAACAWPADEDARVEADVAAIRRGIGDLFQAARSGHPVLLQDAEREVLEGLLDGLEASMAGGKLDAARYNRVLEGYDEAKHLFKELPYNLEVMPGEGLRSISLPLRRHPWWTLSERPLQGWQAEKVESGASLKPTN
jgi:hypothetical protein